MYRPLILSRMKHQLTKSTHVALMALLVLSIGSSLALGQSESDQITHEVAVEVSNHQEGQPQLFGMPIKQGTLYSPDHVRVVNERGQEIPSQITKVTTWEPADESIKWIWVFFFSDEGDQYTVEYGEGIQNGRLYDEVLMVRNNQRPNGDVEVQTGPLRFLIRKGEGGGWRNVPAGSGFLDEVQLDLDGDGFDPSDMIATGLPGRGSFVDLVDPSGEDISKAVVTRTVKEKGSGPLHAIIRVEGEYQYENESHPSAPFVVRVHAFAGKTYIKVDHTFVYTGTPDQSPTLEEGFEYEAIATQTEKIVDESVLQDHPGWTLPNDQIQAAGVRLQYQFSDQATVTSQLSEGNWWQSNPGELRSSKLNNRATASLTQLGPNPSQIPPLVNSSSTSRLSDVFDATFEATGVSAAAERAPGWLIAHDNQWGVGLGFTSFFEEYPKEIEVSESEDMLTAYSWSPKAGPLSFARKDGESDSGMIANFAAGVAKSTEMVLHFFKVDSDAASTGQQPQEVDEAAAQIDALMDPPVAIVDPSWTASTKVFGNISPSFGAEDTYERGLDYKLDWMMFNQKWEPWYGMLNYGDFQTYYYGEEWQMWTNNEPAADFMWWLQFARTGNPEYYHVAKAATRHTMDVDNVHWPLDPVYFGDTNESLHALQAAEQPLGTPYAGMGRRHASQHFTSLLSAHVWVAGWVAAYHMDGNHRALDVARLTADYYVRRPFDDHGLKGRRLYLSIWNLAEVVDATKDPVYMAELNDRLELMKELQYHPDQGGSIVIDRYGYSQIYIANGLRKVMQMRQDSWIRQSVVDNARRLRDLPPYNHDMESYLSSISSLLLGYSISGESSLLDEAMHRARYLKTDPLTRNSDEFSTQREYSEALESVSQFPKTPGAFRPPIWQISNGLRIYGWTSIYQVPYLNYWQQSK